MNGNSCSQGCSHFKRYIVQMYGFISFNDAEQRSLAPRSILISTMDPYTRRSRVHQDGVQAYPPASLKTHFVLIYSLLHPPYAQHALKQSAHLRYSLHAHVQTPLAPRICPSQTTGMATSLCGHHLATSYPSSSQDLDLSFAPPRCMSWAP
ncbi:hypothetical protein CYLTODRAFT_460173 [Cylindrobasidium torrendii FP15055 ss-10]|uniref:Uncharacterized protein n=1 Tax=Cylindrobasidium torrendii FP15055 ss-10 TaxID=1314674 RepID=A0A0D7ASR1_9AGAR|nr:hypothetical protein CYLTODRAFT_460173 [Cylindrobasidium torrendii FP15055 ss-10]